MLDKRALSAPAVAGAPCLLTAYVEQVVVAIGKVGKNGSLLSRSNLDRGNQDVASSGVLLEGEEAATFGTLQTELDDVAVGVELQVLAAVVRTTDVDVAHAVGHGRAVLGISSVDVLAGVLRADNLYVDRVALGHEERDVGVRHLDVSLLTGRHLILSLGLVGIGQCTEGEVLHKEVHLVGSNGTVLNLVDCTGGRSGSSLLVDNSRTSNGD